MLSHTTIILLPSCSPPNSKSYMKPCYGYIKTFCGLQFPVVCNFLWVNEIVATHLTKSCYRQGSSGEYIPYWFYSPKWSGSLKCLQLQLLECALQSAGLKHSHVRQNSWIQRVYMFKHDLKWLWKSTRNSRSSLDSRLKDIHRDSPSCCWCPQHTVCGTLLVSCNHTWWHVANNVAYC